MDNELMRVFAAICASLILWGAAALAQMQSNILWDEPASHHFQGPGDITPFTAWYGLRAYSAAVAATGTQKAADLRRVSDNATCTALIGTDGNLDLTVGTPCNSNTQTVTAWIGASSASVSKMYDQVAGNACGGASCDVVQATAGNQPHFLLTGCGGASTKPCLFSDGSPIKFLGAANNFTPAGTQSSFAVLAECTGVSFLNLAPLIKSGGGFGGSGAVDSIYCDPGPSFGVSGTPGISSFPTTNGVYKTSIAVNNILSIDGVDNTTGVSFTSVTASPPEFAANSQSGGSPDTTDHVGEGGFADNVTWSSGTRTALCHNMRLYWGTGGAC
jgi:hypothetical protein